MKTRITIIEDTFTDYLTKLQSVYEQSQSGILDNLSEDLSHNYIEKYVPKWNPNLFESGENPQNWFKNINMEMSRVEILYTGFTEQAEYMDVFYEMGGFSTLRKTSLERDYALYQEIGKDIYHGSYPEAPQFEGHHYVQRGVADFSKVMDRKVARYIGEILKLNKVYGQTTQSTLI